ncbi:hypothetical protein T265_12712, partial [Opisthorchis viverrini]
MSRARHTNRSGVNTFARSDVKIESIAYTLVTQGRSDGFKSRHGYWIRSSQPGQLLGRRSMSRAHQSHRSSVNTFARSDVKIESSAYTLVTQGRCPGFKSRHGYWM